MIKNVAHKAAEATGEFLGNKMADAKLYDGKSIKLKAMPDANSRDVEEIIIPPEKREEILNELRQVL